MNDRNGEENPDDFDPTKEAFFSDMSEIEDEIATEAYQIVEHALSLIQSEYFDDAIEFLRQAIGLYQQIDRKAEVEALFNKISEVHIIKENAFIEREKEAELSKKTEEDVLLAESSHIEIKRDERITEVESNSIPSDEIGKKVQDISKVGSEEESIKAGELERNKELQERELRSQIEKRIENAEKLGREYEFEFKKAIKEGNLDIPSKYPEIINIYTDARNTALDMGWNEETMIYSTQIRKYKELFERENQVRILERKKAQKDKEFEELLKAKQSEKRVKHIEEIAEISSQKLNLEKEEQRLREQIEKVIQNAEKMGRDYEIEFKKAIKEGNLALDSKYPKIIEIYSEARDTALSKGWKNEAKIYSTHIRKYKELFDRENQIREIEAKKAQKDKEFETMLKIREKESITETQESKIKTKAEQVTKEQLDQKLRSEIDALVKKAEKMGREYEIEFKKAVKKGNLDIPSKYTEVIEFYTEARNMALNKGWDNDVKIYSTQIRKYSELQEKEEKVRAIEKKKMKEKKQFEEMQKIGKKDSLKHIEEEKQIEEGKQIEKDTQILRAKIETMIKKAEKMGRKYEIKFKKAIKEGNLDIPSKYPEIIDIYTEARNTAVNQGWENDAMIYSSQIRKFTELYENENKIREFEKKKKEDKIEFEKSRKIQIAQTSKESENEAIKQQEKVEDKEIQQIRGTITRKINDAEKIAREYDIEFKKAIKEGNLSIKSKYSDIIYIYTEARDIAVNQGWNDEAMIYSSQIRKYNELMQKEKEIKNFEAKKRQQDKEFEEMMKLKIDESGTEIEKMKKIDEANKNQVEEKQFEEFIDRIVDQSEKEAREYELVIRRGQFEKQCPYLEISDKYEDLYKQLCQRGWMDEAEVYSNQMKLYREKYEKDLQLRKHELEKLKKQKEFEESLKVKNGIGSEIAILQNLEKESESELLFNKAMELITEAESAVRSYELSIKKEILQIESPYDGAISKYLKAQKLFKEIGWGAEANRLETTINFYKDKKGKDENLRELEKQKRISRKKEVEKKPKEMELEELKVLEIEKLKAKKEKAAELIFKIIQDAENQSKAYEQQLKKGILNTECPYEEIISKYRKVKLEFEKIGWKEQANQIENSISYYHEKLLNDEKLRTYEREKQSKEEIMLQKKKIQARMAREAEAELLKQKAQALEVKKQRTIDYETKKEQAFSLMDQAKREFKLNNFESAIKLYKESETFFQNINWSDGIKMVTEAIDLIKKKQESIEHEAKLLKEKAEEERRTQKALEIEISKAEELKKMQEEQRRQEFLEIQKQKEQERLISEEAYELLEQGTDLKDKKKFDKAYEKYIKARDLFNKIDWNHEVSRINNDLLFILKKEMKQEEKIKEMRKKKIEEEKELESLLHDAEMRRIELEKSKKEEKRLKREKVVQEEWDRANSMIKELKYNEAILVLKKVLTKLEKMGKEKLIKQVNNQFETLQNASHIPLITLFDLENEENLEKVKSAYKALDNAQISLFNELNMRAISELKEAKFNLEKTFIGPNFIPLIEDKIISLKGEITPEIEPSEEVEFKPKKQLKEDDLRRQIAERRAQRRKRIQDLLKE
jgi:hypothetical protein